MRVLVLAKQLSGFLAAALRRVAAEADDLEVLARRAHRDAPYDDASWGLPLRQLWDDPAELDVQHILSIVGDQRPDVILCVSWNISPYRHVLQRLGHGGPLRVLLMDNQWLATGRQRLAVLAARRYLHRAFDVAWVPSDGAAAFASRLGFRPESTWWGQYAADDVYRQVPGLDGERGFLFVGRLAEAKAVDVLADAYRRYRDAVSDPWDLDVCGTGPLASAFEGLEGARVRGFVTGHELCAAFARSGCLLLPSRFEPWGVVVHEATCAGRPVIVSDAAGAGGRLVLPGHNGLVVPAGDSDALAWAMGEVAGLSTEELRRWGGRSRQLSEQFSVDGWWQTLRRGVEEDPR